jgi:hypothetical protein
MPESTIFVGKEPVVESGVVVLGPSDDSFTVLVDGRSHVTISFISRGNAPPIKAEVASDSRINIKINTWYSGDLNFKFKVGSVSGRDMFLAVHVDVYNSSRVVMYTFSKAAP